MPGATPEHAILRKPQQHTATSATTANRAKSSILHQGLIGGKNEFAVVATLTVTVPVAVAEKSTVFAFSASPVFNWQEAFGAVVVQAKYTRPLPNCLPR